MDIVSPSVRSRMMAGIRSRDTRPELILRSGLWKLGLRFRLHGTKLPGRPDVLLPRWKTVVFVHGCFWHAHAGCSYFKLPATRKDFWRTKLEGNRQRDEVAVRKLTEAGWRVVIVWECALRFDASATIALAAALIRTPSWTGLYQIRKGDNAVTEQLEARTNLQPIQT